VHELSSGRFTLGLGYGWLEEEFEALDVPFKERVSRFRESIEILRLAWQGGEVKYDGQHFSISGVQVTHRRTDIPIILGGNTEKALRRAAQLGDGWFSSGTPPFDEAIRLRAELQRLRAESGVDRPFEIIFRMEGCDPAVARRYRDEGFDSVLIWTDQVWPANQSLEAKRDSMFAAAQAFGLR
jgi:alkanesulfonate monooxygenase SsuD/methylene tetrahydromethanopterin reductase-like flavin-dependent oxidoreductase (luciferase family)